MINLPEYKEGEKLITNNLANNLADLNNLFSATIFKELVKFNLSPTLYKILEKSNNLHFLEQNYTLSNLLNCIYKKLVKSYRCEYVYKNTIVKRHLLGRHSLNTAFVIPELRVVDCKADLVLLNGTSTVYEIKSEYDTTNRITRQLNAYSKVFDKNYIITSEKKIESIKKSIEDHVGILVMTEKEYISEIRSAKSNKKNVLQNDIFNVLRKNEYLDIIQKYYGYVPEVPNTQIYSESKKLFCELEPEVTHDEMVIALKNRGNSQSLKDFINTVPQSLKALSLTNRFTNNDRKKITELLNKKVNDIIYKI